MTKKEMIMELLKDIKNSSDFIFNEEKELIIVFNGGDYANVYSLDSDEEDYFISEKSQWKFCRCMSDVEVEEVK